jgi:hypothetical protein
LLYSGGLIDAWRSHQQVLIVLLSECNLLAAWIEGGGVCKREGRVSKREELPSNLYILLHDFDWKETRQTQILSADWTMAPSDV